MVPFTAPESVKFPAANVIVPDCDRQNPSVGSLAKAMEGAPEVPSPNNPDTPRRISCPMGVGAKTNTNTSAVKALAMRFFITCPLFVIGHFDNAVSGCQGNGFEAAHGFV